MNNLKAIKETPYGVYVWQMPDGSVVANEEKDFLSVASIEGDLQKMSLLAAAVRGYGINEGKPLFLSGHRKVSDEEYEAQKARLEEGLIPDQYDIGAWKEEERLRGNR